MTGVTLPWNRGPPLDRIEDVLDDLAP